MSSQDPGASTSPFPVFLDATMKFHDFHLKEEEKKKQQHKLPLCGCFNVRDEHS